MVRILIHDISDELYKALPTEEYYGNETLAWKTIETPTSSVTYFAPSCKDKK